MSCANEIPFTKDELALVLTALDAQREKLFRHHRDTPEGLAEIEDLEEKLKSWL